jgi:phosphatidylserine decarboxylase
MEIHQDHQPVSASFLFVLSFITLRIILRNLFFEKSLRMVPDSSFNLSFSRKMFMTEDGEFDHQNLLQSIFGYFASTIHSVYSIYKMSKKYDFLRYTISLSRVVSRLTGFMCSLWLPKFMRYPVFGLYAWFYQIDMSEVLVEDFGYYETFTLFFTRRLKQDARPLYEPANDKSMCSPCDGRVLTCGVVNSEYSTVDCVKGRSYRLDEFMLGEQGDQGSDRSDNPPNNSQIAAMLDKVKQRGNQMFWMVIYLSPADYHRFHSPCYHTADYRRHVVGYLCPVKPSYVNQHKDVFKTNERVNIFGRWAQGFYFESAVGATNVGSIKLDFDSEVLTNKAVPTYPYFEDKSYLAGSAEKQGPFNKYLSQSEFSREQFTKEKDLVMQKGEMTGRFEMGSTIVLIFEADKKTALAIKEGQKLNMGDKLVTHSC